MDNTIRKHEKCIIGSPRCDYVFSSTRSCFIAYGFSDSPLEMGIIKRILESKEIAAIEAGGNLTPAQNVFCTKICSKIITSQFCVVLLNNEEANGREIPNANVNMEYGLMMGFNKYIIPFQKRSQKLPFNVVNLDTVKYDGYDFERLAVAAIDQAIAATSQTGSTNNPIDQKLDIFLITKKYLISSIADPGNKSIFDLGAQLGFNLLHDFTGMNYAFFGNFSNLRTESILWKTKTLLDILLDRCASFPQRLSTNVADPNALLLAHNVIANAKVIIIVNSELDKEAFSRISSATNSDAVEVYSIKDVEEELQRLEAYL